MTPQEKAEELVNKFKPMMYCYVGSEMLTNTFNKQEQIRNAKQCALIAVDEIIEAIRYRTLYTLGEELTEEVYVPYWQEVQHEIEKL